MENFDSSEHNYKKRFFDLIFLNIQILRKVKKLFSCAGLNGLNLYRLVFILGQLLHGAGNGQQLIF